MKSHFLKLLAILLASCSTAAASGVSVSWSTGAAYFLPPNASSGQLDVQTNGPQIVDTSDGFKYTHTALVFTADDASVGHTVHINYWIRREFTIPSTTTWTSTAHMDGTLFTPADGSVSLLQLFVGTGFLDTNIAVIGLGSIPTGLFSFNEKGTFTGDQIALGDAFNEVLHWDLVPGHSGEVFTLDLPDSADAEATLGVVSAPEPLSLLAIALGLSFIVPLALRRRWPSPSDSRQGLP